MMPKKKKKKDLEDEPVSRIKSATVLPKNASTDKEPHDEGKLTSILQKFDSNNIDEEVINTAKSKLTTLDSKTKKSTVYLDQRLSQPYLRNRLYPKRAVY